MKNVIKQPLLSIEVCIRMDVLIWFGMQKLYIISMKIKQGSWSMIIIIKTNFLKIKKCQTI